MRGTLALLATFSFVVMIGCQRPEDSSSEVEARTESAYDRDDPGSHQSAAEARREALAAAAEARARAVIPAVLNRPVDPRVVAFWRSCGMQGLTQNQIEARIRLGRIPTNEELQSMGIVAEIAMAAATFSAGVAYNEYKDYLAAQGKRETERVRRMEYIQNPTSDTKSNWETSKAEAREAETKCMFCERTVK